MYKALGEIFEQSNSISLASRFYKNAALLAPEDFNDDYLYKLTLDQALSDLSTIKFYLQENRATHEVKPSDKCFDGENCVQHTYSWISASEEYCDNLKNTSTDRLNLSEKQNFYLNLKTISMCDRPFLYGITLNKRGEVFEETLISSNFYIHNLKNLYFLELAGASIDEIKAAQGKTAASKTHYLTDPEGNILNAFIRNRFLGAKKLNTEEKSFVENIIFLGSEQKITKNHVNRQLSTVLLDAEAETDKNSNERMGKVATRIHHTKPKQPESISIEAFLPELLKQPFPDQDSSAKNTLAISESSDSDRSPKSNKPQNQQTNSKTDLSGAASTNSGLIHGVIQKWQDIKRQAFVNGDTSGLSSVLTGKALSDTEGGVKWWQSNGEYHSITLNSLDFLDTQVNGSSASVRVRISETKHNSVEGNKTSTYNATYGLEKRGDNWYISSVAAE